MGGLLAQIIMNNKLLWWIFAITQGGLVRAKIAKKLNERPLTTSQLARELNLTYQDIRYHLKILAENKLVESIGDSRYIYFITEDMEGDWDEFMKIWEIIENTFK